MPAVRLKIFLLRISPASLQKEYVIERVKKSFWFNDQQYITLLLDGVIAGLDVSPVAKKFKFTKQIYLKGQKATVLVSLWLTG